MSYHQDLVRETLRYWFPEEEILENYRPNWLNGLELDFYFPKYKIAIEVQGRQHRCWTPDFQDTYVNLKHQKNRDNIKRNICDSYNITLIEVNHVLSSLIIKLKKELPKELRQIVVRNQLPYYLQDKWKKYLSTWFKIEHRRKKSVKSLKKEAAKTYLALKSSGKYVPFVEVLRRTKLKEDFNNF